MVGYRNVAAVTSCLRKEGHVRLPNASSNSHQAELTGSATKVTSKMATMASSDSTQAYINQEQPLDVFSERGC